MPDPKSLHNPPLAEQSRSPTVVASGSPVLVYHPCGSNGTVQPFAAKKRRLEFDDIDDSRLRKTIDSCLETFIQTMIAETKALVIEEIVESTSHWCSLIENHDEEVKEKLDRVNRSFAMMDARMMALEKETNESKSSIATLKEEAKQYKEDIRRMRLEEMTSKQEIEAPDVRKAGDETWNPSTAHGSPRWGPSEIPPGDHGGSISQSHVVLSGLGSMSRAFEFD